MQTKRNLSSFTNSRAKAWLLTSTLWFVTACMVSAQMTNDEIQLQAYMALVKADGAKDEGLTQSAITSYQSALISYKELKAQAPDFKPEIIDYRISYCANQIEDLGESNPNGKIQPSKALEDNSVYKEQVLELQGKIQELEQKLTQAPEPADSKGRKEKRLEEEVASLRKQQDVLKQNLKDASRNVEAAKNEAQKNLNERLYQAELEQKKAQQEIDTLKTAAEQQSKQRTSSLDGKSQQEIKRVKEAAELQIQTLVQAENQSKKEILMLKEQIQQLSKSHRELENESSRTIELEASLDRAVEKIKMLEEERAVMESALEIAQSSKFAGSSKIETLKTQHQQALQNAEAARRKVEALEGKMASGRQANQSLQKELLQLKAQQGHHEGANLQLEGKLKEYTAALDQAELTLSENQNTLRKHMAEKDVLVKQLSALENKRSADQNKQAQGFEEQIAALNEKHRRAEEHIGKLNEEVNSVKHQNEQLVSSKLAAEKQALKNEQAVGKLQEKIDVLNDRHQKTIEDLGRLEASSKSAIDKAMAGEKQSNALQNKIKDLALGLEKAKFTNTELKASVKDAEKKKKESQATIAMLEEKISEVAKKAKREAQMKQVEADTKQGEAEKVLRAEAAIRISDAQEEAKAAIEAAEKRVAGQLKIQQEKLKDQIAKVNSSASARGKLRAELEATLRAKTTAEAKAEKLALGLNKAFEANAKLQSAVDALKTENTEIAKLKSALASSLIERDTVKSRYEALAARVDESEAKEKFMRLNAEETLSQLETLQIQHNKVMGQFNTLRDQNLSYQKETKASTQEKEAIKKAMDALNTESLLPMKAKIKDLEEEKVQLSRMMKETKELAESHQRSATALIQEKENAVRHGKISLQDNEKLIKKLEGQLEDQAVTLAAANTLQQAHDDRQTQLQAALTQIEEYRALSTKLQTQADENTRALRNQEELLTQIDEMDQTLLRLREEAAMVPGLANAQRVAEASLVTQGEQISALQANLVEKEAMLDELVQYREQTDVLKAEKDAAILQVQEKMLELSSLQKLNEDLHATSNTATQEVAYLGLKLTEARNEIQTLSRQQLDLIRQIRTLLGGPTEPEKKK